jgi:hypothetical protein
MCIGYCEQIGIISLEICKNTLIWKNTIYKCSVRLGSKQNDVCEFLFSLDIPFLVIISWGTIGINRPRLPKLPEQPDEDLFDFGGVPARATIP